ncbi:MAG: hypothetical protein MUF62_03790 [Chitinophagaceae bacterium]|jgi:uncharacterized protein YbjT (DUF2867 family)|nr:hypothetical protein [Chitinophagaceae bacterium]
MRIALAGASGLVGGYCLQHLLQAQEVSAVISIGRKPLPVQHAKLQQVQLSAAGKLEQPVQADAFLCSIGTTAKKTADKGAYEAIDRHLPVHLATVLQQQGCHRVAIVTALGANAQSGIFYNRVKGLVEEDLQQLGLQSLCILRPSIIDGPRQESRPGEQLALKVMKFFAFIIPASYRAVHADVIARALVQCGLHAPTGQFTYLSPQLPAVAEGRF